MAYQIDYFDFNNIISELSSSFHIWAPVKLTGKGAFSDTDLITYGKINCIEEVVYDSKTSFSPKEIIFPPNETLFYFTEEEFKEPVVDDKKILIFARPCDINAFKRLDSIFIENGPYADPYYKLRRDKVKFALMECDKGFYNCFCVSMNTNKTSDYSMLVRPEKDKVSCLVNDSSFYPYFQNLSENADIEPQFVEVNKISINIPEEVDYSIFEDPVWEEYTSRCIGCGRCNLSCPTCTCFTMQDVFFRDNPRCGERRRVWASCMIDGFTDMSGGHGPRQKQGERMRFKVMHKLNDFKRRFGFHMCVGCGRCDDVCPEYISLVKCVERLNQLAPGVEKND